MRRSRERIAPSSICCPMRAGAARRAGSAASRIRPLLDADRRSARAQRRRKSGAARQTCIFRPKTGGRKLQALPGADVEHLGIDPQRRCRQHGELAHAAHAALPRLSSGHAGRSKETHGRRQAGAVARSRTPAKSSAWPTSSPSTTCLPPGQPHPRRRKLRRRNLLLRRRSAHHHAGQGLRPGRRHVPRRQPGDLRRARSVRRIGSGGHRVRSGRSRRLPRFSPISAICRLAITSSTSSTASASTRD